jgi:hypothetical protein
MNNIEALDLIFFRPEKSHISNIIGKVQEITLGCGDWTHVGIALNYNVLPYCLELDKNKKSIFIWESTINLKKIGVQINNLSIYTNKFSDTKFNGKIAIGKLINNPAKRLKNESDIDYFNRLSPIRKIVTNLYLKTVGTPYACGLCNLCGSLFKCIRPLRELTFKSNFLKKISGKEWLFCSQLACMLYHDLGIIDKKVKAMDTVPMDFLGFDKDGMKKHFKDPIIIYDSKKIKK